MTKAAIFPSIRRRHFGTPSELAACRVECFWVGCLQYTPVARATGVFLGIWERVANECAPIGNLRTRRRGSIPNPHALCDYLLPEICNEHKNRTQGAGERMPSASLRKLRAWALRSKSLTVSPIPATMPCPTEGRGLREQYCQVIGSTLGTGMQYYWRPSIERGLCAPRLSEGNCICAWQGFLHPKEPRVLSSLYRSNLRAAYRSGQGAGHQEPGRPCFEETAHRSVPIFRHATALSEHH